MNKLKVDVCVIGGGAAGLSVAAAAVQMGASVVLVEENKMGGDCLNVGCVPSKSMLASAKVAQTLRESDQFGVKKIEPEVNFHHVMQHVHEVIESIRPHDSESRFKKLGVKVIKARGHFVNEKTVRAGQTEIYARRFVIATGSHAAVPAIPGIEKVSYLTNETLFSQTEKPAHLIIIGAGPMGVEMAQAHKRLSVRVSLLDIGSLLPRDDAELVDVVRKKLLAEGVELHENVQIQRVEEALNSVNVLIEEKGKQVVVSGTHLLVATGRKPNLAGLDLDKANIKTDEHGIRVDSRLRSMSNKKVFVAGDVAGHFQLTHAASYHAGVIIRNILFGLPSKLDMRAMPWCTYVDPELAQVGVQAAELAAKKIAHRVLTCSFEDNDRAQAEKRTEGLIKVIVNHRGIVLGCGIVGPHAGELILPWCLAVQEKMKISKMASVIAPYPTLSEISKRVAGSYYTARLFSPRVQHIVRFIQRYWPG